MATEKTYLGFKTLDVGQQGLHYDHKGKATVEVGPKRIFLFRERVINMTPFTADQSEYLVIKFRDGNIVHQPGPCKVFENPLEHKEITVQQAIELDANEVLLVYKQDQETKVVQRYIEYGPTRFIKGSNEWIHTFSWHGTNPHNKTQMLAGQHVFSKLQVTPGQFYYNVDEVRTADDALIRVKLMMFYELINIEQMLSNTSDPMADFINCICADVVAFCAKLTYMEFMEQSGDMNEIENYPQLVDRCKVIGYDVSKVVFRGYYAAPKLQALHDKTVAKRTDIKLAYESEEQKQLMIKKDLESEMSRINLEHSLDLEKLQHKQALEKSQQLHGVEMSKNACIENLKHMKADEKNKLEGKKLEDAQEEDYLSNLSDIGVDINAILLAQNPQPLNVIKVCTQEGAANFHLHK